VAVGILAENIGDLIVAQRKEKGWEQEQYKVVQADYTGTAMLEERIVDWLDMMGIATDHLEETVEMEELEPEPVDRVPVEAQKH
jgi:hypothetical protein